MNHNKIDEVRLAMLSDLLGQSRALRDELVVLIGTTEHLANQLGKGSGARDSEGFPQSRAALDRLLGRIVSRLARVNLAARFLSDPWAIRLLGISPESIHNVRCPGRYEFPGKAAVSASVELICSSCGHVTRSARAGDPCSDIVTA